MSFFCYLDLPSDPSFLHVCATSVVSFIELLLPLYDILRLYRRHFRDPIRDRRTFSFSFLQVKCLLIQILNRHFGLRYSVKYSMTEEDTIKQGSPSFLDKLYTILEEESPHIISWNGEGDTFIIFSPELFSQKVMSKYFKSTKFNSFVRQLNFYGFKKTDSRSHRLMINPFQVGSGNFGIPSFCVEEEIYCAKFIGNKLEMVILTPNHGFEN